MTNDKATFVMKVLERQKKVLRSLSPHENDTTASINDIEEAICIIKAELFSNARRAETRKK